jgi:hypothetical protein
MSDLINGFLWTDIYPSWEMRFEAQLSTNATTMTEIIYIRAYLHRVKSRVQQNFVDKRRNFDEPKTG